MRVLTPEVENCFKCFDKIYKQKELSKIDRENTT